MCCDAVIVLESAFTIWTPELYYLTFLATFLPLVPSFRDDSRCALPTYYWYVCIFLTCLSSAHCMCPWGQRVVVVVVQFKILYWRRISAKERRVAYSVEEISSYRHRWTYINGTSLDPKTLVVSSGQHSFSREGSQAFLICLYQAFCFFVVKSLRR